MGFTNLSFLWIRVTLFMVCVQLDVLFHITCTRAKLLLLLSGPDEKLRVYLN